MIKVKVRPDGAKHVEIWVYAAHGSFTPAFLGTLRALRGREAQELVERLSNGFRDPVLELDGCLELPESASRRTD